MTLRRRALLAAVLLMGSAPWVRATGPDEPSDPDPGAGDRLPLRPEEEAARPEGALRPDLSAARVAEEEEGVYRAEGYVDLRYGDLRLQADRVVFDSRSSDVEAEGNVVLQQGEGSLAASRLEINLETGEATLWDVTGFQPPSYIFRAARVERIDAERYRIFDAVFTTCTQPVPNWSLRVKRGFIRLNHYAHLRGTTFKTSKVPLFYSPYVLWPLKPDRATGLLLPQFGSSAERGTVVGAAFFWAIRRNMDATFFLDYYTDAGSAQGLEYRYVPNERGSGRFTGYYLGSDVDPDRSERYRFRYQAEQAFGEGWRMLADLNRISDSEYFNDFERDLGLSVSTAEVSFADLSRTWSYNTLSVRADRREQFFTGTDTLVQQRLPEVEIRGRSRRLGRSALYLSFEGSAAGLERRESGLDAAYERLDLGTTLSASMTPFPWLDLTPSLTVRDTYYTQRRDPTMPDGVSDDDLDRPFLRAQFEILGPKLFRIFDPSGGERGPRYKNTLEPRLSYDYVPDVEESAEVILFDEIDSLPTDLNLLTYSLTSRLFRRRPLPARKGEAPGQYGSPEEIASIEVRQSVSFGRDLSTSTAPERASSQGPLTLQARYNPTRTVSGDLRLDYDVLFDTVRTVSLSGSAGSEHLGRVRLSYYLNRGLEDGVDDTGTVSLGGGSALLRKRLSFDLDLSYDLGEDSLQSQRYRLGYQTQCCGFQTEYLERNYSGLVEAAREFRFSVTLTGVGTLLDLNSRLN